MQLRFNIDDQVNSVIVIPAYNELESLPNLIYKLKKHFSINDAILIVDDSSFEIYEKTELECRKVLTDQKSKLYFIHNSVKNGRGNAVRREISAAIKTFNLN